MVVLDGAVSAEPGAAVARESAGLQATARRKGSAPLSVQLTGVEAAVVYGAVSVGGAAYLAGGLVYATVVRESGAGAPELRQSPQ